MQEYMEKFPRNKVVKVELKELIDKRKKFLRHLRIYDYKRFEWLLEKLDLFYRPYPEKFHWITRKESLEKATVIHCEKVKQEKLEAYKKELQSQQLKFLENKLKNLEFIRKEQQECKVPVTITAEEIAEVKKQFSELKEKRDEEEAITAKQTAIDDYEYKL
jgi:small subunit ribosomal protein S15